MFSAVAPKETAKQIETRTIEEAYQELSQEAFACWVRLMVATAEELGAGRGTIARLLNYSEGRSNAILRELKLKQYLRLEPGAYPGLPTSVVIVKRCKLVGRNHFVKLSASLLAASEEPEELDTDWLNDLCDGLPIPSQSNRAVLFRRRAAATLSHSASSNVSRPQSKPKTAHGTKKAPQSVKNAESVEEDGLDDLYSGLVSESGSGVIERPRALSKESQKNGTKKHSAAERKETARPTTAKALSGPQNKAPAQSSKLATARAKTAHDSESRPGLLGKKKGIDLSKLPTKEERRAKRVVDRNTAPTHPEVGQPIDWTRFDLNDKPIISFDPDDSEREKLIAILSGDPRRMSAQDRKVRKQLLEKLRQEFSRVYERYRRAVLREKGARMTMYSVLPEEHKYAERAALACIMRGVTPTQVFQYWHENIGNFADARMPVPPLTFLSQPANIDAVAIAGLGAAKREALPPRARAPKREREASMHPLSDTSLLHPGLRRSLMDAGFDLSKINDKYLVTVQAYALDVAHGGEELRFIPIAMRGMVKHAAEKVYRDVDPNDYL